MRTGDTCHGDVKGTGEEGGERGVWSIGSDVRSQLVNYPGGRAIVCSLARREKTKCQGRKRKKTKDTKGPDEARRERELEDSGKRR